VQELAQHCRLSGGVQVGVAEDDERAVAAEFQCDVLDEVAADGEPSHVLAHRRRSRERDQTRDGGFQLHRRDVLTDPDGVNFIEYTSSHRECPFHPALRQPVSPPREDSFCLSCRARSSLNQRDPAAAEPMKAKLTLKRGLVRVFPPRSGMEWRHGRT
jgi:hypothetical protein